ncbi:uncharacterized protein MYCFIDRAFT_178452 [Pseudocercospora fijiensis CIRAD86]|uniref:Zn(2)-C6 fungal-type domain-containing protein n=1 Tax=Pseudocercospora fijiensis (strain CIRAD86) TaxID=383855 RepID=M2ZGQ2_PSEFD|nr:uncharacterized protein MYCFIDRAFT_178452 [Pseudocercospora fijiensis CIRAD86]EME78294.1 hypothetical protein MYCFIDRAFT_178452 [Pseudocercospora fijiensis CIRAD86]
MTQSLHSLKVQREISPSMVSYATTARISGPRGSQSTSRCTTSLVAGLHCPSLCCAAGLPPLSQRSQRRRTQQGNAFRRYNSAAEDHIETQTSTDTLIDYRRALASRKAFKEGGPDPPCVGFRSWTQLIIWSSLWKSLGFASKSFIPLSMLSSFTPFSTDTLHTGVWFHRHCYQRYPSTRLTAETASSTSRRLLDLIILQGPTCGVSDLPETDPLFCALLSIVEFDDLTRFHLGPGTTLGSNVYRVRIGNNHTLLHPGSLKRKLSSLLRPVRYGEVSYPSPPMSNPPSPPRLPQDHSATLASVSQPSTSSSITATSTLMPAVAIATSSLGPPFYEPAAQAPGNARSPPSFPPPTSAAAVATSSQSQPTSAAPTAWQPSAENEPSTRPTSSRGGRKSKAHVASACINCKRAHLSCDVNRPCARCVASGKQVWMSFDTCFDVQHKKRGRPRLREEGDFKVEQTLPEARPTTAIPSGSSDPSTRPLAATRPRRAESFRSLRSQGSDSSGAVASPTYPLPPPPTATRPTFDFHYHPIAPSVQHGYEVPTVFLDLDLVIIKANMPYRHIMVGGREVAGRQLSDIAMPMDGESFQAIRARLRAEREAREPVYMPPIVQPGQDPLNGALEADVERYTQGFDDRTYNWTQTQMGHAAVTFPARVRLAKANAFFVAVTLPTFRPVEPPPPPPLYARMPAAMPLQTQSSDGYTTTRPFATHSAPASAYTPFPAASPLMAPLRSIGHQSNRSYPPPQPTLPYQQQTQPQSLQQPTQPHAIYQPPPSGTPRLPVAEPPTETTAFTPRSAARELPGASSTHSAMQLPPIIGSSAHPPTTRIETPPAGPAKDPWTRTKAKVHLGNDNEWVSMMCFIVDEWISHAYSERYNSTTTLSRGAAISFQHQHHYIRHRWYIHQSGFRARHSEKRWQHIIHLPFLHDVGLQIWPQWQLIKLRDQCDK